MYSFETNLCYKYPLFEIYKKGFAKGIIKHYWDHMSKKLFKQSDLNLRR